MSERTGRYHDPVFERIGRHLLETRYACPVCSACFPDLASKKTHIRTEHREDRRRAK